MNFLKEQAAKLKDMEDKHKLSETAKDAFTEAKKFIYLRQVTPSYVKWLVQIEQS